MVARVDIDIVRGLSATDSHDLQYRIVERHGEGPVPLLELLRKAETRAKRLEPRGNAGNSLLL
jgi:hypothetical protein